TTVSNNRTVTIKDLPFHAGDKVEIIVRGYEREQEYTGHYPLRGKAIRYVDPFGSVAEDDWDAQK
ncbi:MAG TPA: hypothetical protein DCK87_09125, partial [Desulfotomaculum sp.]|nr:hypothetical protein [Desulfotomaculum sp.]